MILAMRSASAAIVRDGFRPIAFGTIAPSATYRFVIAEHLAVVIDDAVGGRLPMLQPPSGCGVIRSCAIVQVSGVSGMPPVARASCWCMRDDGVDRLLRLR